MIVDYNAKYGPLHVYEQSGDACFYHANGLAIAAKIKAYTGVEPTWPNGAPPPFQYTGHAWAASIGGDVHSFAEAGTVTKSDRAAVRAAVDSCGVLAVGLEVPASIKLFDATSLPVIHVKDGDLHQSAHSLLVVGYTDDGPLVQSSWGIRWGFQGRAVLGWDWWDAFVVSCTKLAVDSFPVDGMPEPKIPIKPDPTPVVPPTPAPAPTPAAHGGTITLVKRHGGSGVYALHGGCRSWVNTRAVLAIQGLSMDDVHELPTNDPVWKLPLIGNKPPNGDI